MAKTLSNGSRTSPGSRAISLFGAAAISAIPRGAIANSRARDRVKAVSLHVTLTNFRDRTYAFDSFTLEASIGWTLTMLNVFRASGMNAFAAMLTARKTRSITKQAMQTIPLRQADRGSDTRRRFLVAGLDGSRRAGRPLVGRDQLWKRCRDHPSHPNDGRLV